MIDQHVYPDNWGIYPVLFSIGNAEISTYSFFMALGMLAGLITYFMLAKKMRYAGEKSFYIVFAGVIGGILGSKIFYWIFNFQTIVDQFPNLMAVFSGKTITGGLIGGTLGVIFIKRKLKIRDKKGNIFAPAIAVGLAVGRLGCFFRGCCYGTETSLFTGVDFGDSIHRHPTQLYEALFFVLFFIFAINKIRSYPPGMLFFILMNSYFVFRFFQEFIRYNDHIYYGLSFFQFISLAALIFINVKFVLERRAYVGLSS